MKGFSMNKETPDNIEELKRKANNKSNWRDRLSAVNELRDYDCQQSRDILTRLAIHDPVFKVKEAAFQAAQAMKITKDGQPIRLTKMPKGNLIKGIQDKLQKTRDVLPDDYSLEDFKLAFKNKYPIAYDTYEGSKGDQFDKWLMNVTKNLKKKS